VLGFVHDMKGLKPFSADESDCRKACRSAVGDVAGQRHLHRDAGASHPDLEAHLTSRRQARLFDAILLIGIHTLVGMVYWHSLMLYCYISFIGIRTLAILFVGFIRSLCLNSSLMLASLFDACVAGPPGPPLAHYGAYFL
jgi:hypothetical protein